MQKLGSFVLAAAVGVGLANVGAAAEPVVLQAEGKVLRATCHGDSARIEGNRNSIVLDGGCRGLQLNGVANQVTIDLRDGATVRVEGSANRITYRVKSGAPSIVVLGADNAVRSESVSQLAEAPRSPATQPGVAPAPLVLAGDDEQLAADCTGRDVVIHGTRSAYVLRGGCRSIMVQGDLINVQAEVVRGTRIAIEGAGTIVAWATAAGAVWQDAPVQSVHGRNSRVQRTDTIGGQPVH